MAVCLQIVVDETQIDLFQQVTDSVDRVHVDVQTLRQINIIVEKYVIWHELSCGIFYFVSVANVH